MENIPHNPHEVVKLDPIDMHGPVETSVIIHIRLPDGRNAHLAFQMEPGRIPTRAAIKEVVDACLDPQNMEASAVPQGTRVLTKPEFVEHITKRETGRAIPMPGESNWVPASCEIPHGMLVHAIQGVGGPDNLETEYITRGLAKYIGPGDNYVFTWDCEKLAELPDDMLLEIYRRITG